MRGGYRRFSIWATIQALRALGPREPMRVRDVLSFINNYPEPVPRPWHRDMELRTVKTFLTRAARAGFLEVRKSEEYLGPTRYKVNEYTYKECENVIIRAKIRQAFLDEILEGKKTVEYRQIEDLILDDGRRTLHCRVLNIENAGPLKKDIMERFPGIPWNPQLPIFIFNIEPLVLWDGREHKDLSTGDSIKPWEVARIIKGED